MDTRSKDLATIGLCAALLTLCGWIQIPAPIPFSLQTFGVFFTLFVLGGKKGSLTVALYLGMGLIGLPVFSGFRGGFGVIASPTGGFLLGFLALAFSYWWIMSLLPSEKWSRIAAAAIGQLVCYICGTAWYACLYAPSEGGLWTAILTCVVPFLLPDALKLIMARLLYSKLKNWHNAL